MRTITDSAIVVKVYNNNIVSVDMNGVERILFNKGIGFGKRIGDVIQKGTEIEKIFVIEDKDNLRSFEQVVNSVDEEFLSLCEKMISFIASELKEDLDERIHVALVDHLNFAVKRLSNQEVIENPFIMEVKALYSQEYMLAEKVAQMLQEETKITIPDSEIGFIALHIHSARNNGRLSTILRSTQLINLVIQYTEQQLQLKIDKTSLDYARFLTHLRFAIKRILLNIPITNDFIRQIKSKYKLSYKVAKGVSKILTERLEKDVPESETAYLAMHIERLRIATLES
ncbi:PRD domain-containing protein [Clostridium swellfunianum]|uniref:glucose PTS transporter transcription antiterminator GlcT n=1 Tax=Clostridium swellfunianum TaxID=1367462 RepID=UPI00202EC1D6|nr:PRD domain-containing protein [Clostridium swellfunianum]MCM0647504.1 PRD domain-containing protein [Clostridium swellfunianum]